MSMINMQIKSVILALVCTLLYSCATPVSVSLPDPVEYRLPPEIQPTAQTIELKLDPSTPDYAGNTVLQIDVLEDVDRIGIYQLGLEMSAITLVSDSDSRPLDATLGEFDINWLSDGAIIPAGQYKLSINFNGNYATDSLGMHRARFENNDYVFTQMESMYLRRSVPSFDEPSFKIPYTLIITAPEDLTVVANTPVESTSIAEGWQRVEFMPTKPLSSYLIAYAVGPLDRAEIKGMSIPGYIYTPKGHADEVGFVLRHTPAIVKSLENYFGSDYPFRKLDFVAVPEFAYGAMENPGLITYRTDFLLIGDHATGSTASLTLSVIAHEVAHIWYGDLVTMAWWNDLWLNEAFASWMAASTMHRLFPQYETDLDLPQTGAFAGDQITGSKSIRKETRTEADVNEGAILAYSKGETLLMMLENYVGAESWQAGIREYVKKFAWSNATESDLWEVISEVSGTDVRKIAGDYLNQPGFPILSIDVDGRVSQTRYVPYGLEAPELQWTIPLSVKYKKDGKVHETFSLLEEQTGQIELPDGADWIFPDAGANGYFRWEIDREQFYALVDDVAALESREKIALLDNSDALLRARKLPLEDYMLVINKLLDDPHPLVLLPTIDKVKAIGDQFVDEDNADLFARFVDAGLSDRFNDVGVETREGDSEALIQLRPRLVRILGQYGSDPAVRVAAAEKADLYLASADAVDANLGLEVLRVTALNDDGGRYEKYMDAYLNSATADQKTNILASIYFQDPEIVKAALDFFISDAVAAGDALYGVYFYRNVLDDHSMLYQWLEANLADFEAKIPSYYHQVLPQYMAGTCNETNFKLLTKFFTDRDEKYDVSLGKAIETMRTCIARRERDSAALMEFLARYN